MILGVAARTRLLLSRKGPLIALAAGLLLAFLLPFLPLSRVVGYESALLSTALVAILGGIFGIAAGRQEIDLERGGRSRAEGSTGASLRAFAAAATPSLSLLGGIVGWTSLLSALRGGCSITLGLPWYLVLPLPTLALSTSLGLLLSLSTPKPRFAPLAYVAVLGAFALGSIRPILAGPQVFFYDHFFGYLPGPLYDELISIEPRLLAFRGLTLAWALLALAGASLVRRRWRFGADHGAVTAVVGCLVALVAVGTGHRHRFDWGVEQTNETVAAALGATLEGEACLLHHPRELPREEAARFLLECDARMEQLSDFFGVPKEQVTVFLHRSREEKRLLVGAGTTQFAKPWLRQIHVDRRSAPHPVLKHELAHLVAAPLGRGPFGVSASLFGLLPIQGLVEGAAVAADWPGGELSVHEQARAMRSLGLAPDLPKTLSAWGFWSQPASRAYTYAGSFIRWLWETEGQEALAALYRKGDFSAATGKPLRELVETWEAFLDETPLDPTALAVAEARFRRPSIFRLPCARELAVLSAEARDAATAGDGLQAAALCRKLGELNPDDPRHRVAEAEAWVMAKEPEEVWALAEAEEARGGSTLVRARLWTLAGDALAQDLQPDRALEAYEKASRLTVSTSGARSLAIKQAAAADPVLAGVVFPYLATGSDGPLLEIRELLQARRDWGTGWYLVGRRLHQRGQHEGAARDLGRALEAGLPQELEWEARKLQALSLAATGAYEDACPALHELTEEGSEGQRIEAADLAYLCESDQAR